MASASDTTLKQLQVILTANTAQLQTAMSHAQKATNAAAAQIQNSISKIDAALKALGAAAAAYISVKALVDFGKEALELASDLTEVQNVVDVTFGSLSGKIDTFAKGAIKSFGLSETAAKKYSSTMGSLLKSMGLTVEQAYDMSTAMTGLAGDIASFYNMSADEAFSKLRAGISGETEPLKQLGINMSQANLEAFALSQGIDKSFQSMTQAEQATLRYNYILNATKDAQGDFSRTSDSWANQVKILSMQFDSLKASLGQGLIMVLTPVIKVINQIISALSGLAERFKTFMASITGTDLSPEVSEASTALLDAENSASDFGETTEKSMQKAEKATKRFLMGFDEIHKMEGEDESLVDNDSLEALTAPSTLAGMEALNEATESEGDALQVIDDALGKVSAAMEPVIQRASELADSFKEGFADGLGSNFSGRITGIIEDVKSIGANLQEIFTDPAVLDAANQFADKVAVALGQIVGSVINIGVTIGENIIGGIQQNLQENGDRIKNYLSEMFNIGGDIVEKIGNFADSIGEIFSAFGGENGQALTANFIGIFQGAFMSVTALAGKFIDDVIGIITTPLTLNTEGIKAALDDILGILKGVTDTIEQAVQFIGDKANEVYDEHIGPLMESIGEGLSKIVGSILQVWDNTLKPMLEEGVTKIQELWDVYLQPFFSKLGDFIGQVADTLKSIWEGVLQPLISWIIENVINNILPTLGALFSTAISVLGDIANAIGGVLDVLTGLLGFITNIFTGQWDKAFEDAKKALSGLLHFVEGVGQGIMDFFGGLFDTIAKLIGGIVDTIVGGLGEIVNFVGGLFGLNTNENPDEQLEKALASGNYRYANEVNGTAYNAMASTGASKEDMYGAVSDALADQQGEEIAIYIDGEQIASAIDQSRAYRNARINPALAY